MDWETLESAIRACTRCGLCEGRRHAVPGIGDRAARWLFVGEGPGRNEDQQGEPFVGPAGKLLDNMLRALGLARGANTYIANIVKCRPVGGDGRDRPPAPDEVSACLPYLQRQIALLRPDVIVALGKTAAISLLGLAPNTSLGSLRGEPRDYDGIPLVVIEAKSPKVKDALPEAIDQLMRYSEQRGSKGEGSAELFAYNQFLVVTCRNEAKFGTITTHNEKHFYRWSDPYPLKLEDLQHGSSSPNDQQRLVAGMMAHANLLGIVHTFTIFNISDKGELIKVVGRYQQFRAVKLAVQRLLSGKNARERSGIIWHTQGSGKSIVMVL